MLADMNTPKAETVKLQVTLDLETNGDTEAEELQYLLHLLGEEIRRAKKFQGKIRRVQFKHV